MKNIKVSEEIHKQIQLIKINKAMKSQADVVEFLYYKAIKNENKAKIEGADNEI